MKRGLIVGKFYPPHRGHKFLIDAGCTRVDELSVIVYQKLHEQPAGELRAAWLREMHPDVRVRLIDDTYNEQDPRVWAENTICRLGFVPDVVFTSEDYGDRFAYYLGSQHQQIDRARNAVPISDTQIRATPLRYWEFLELPVRGWSARRICLVGAESTGKTTLARKLAEHYQTVWVAEYGREYAERRLATSGNGEWCSEEFTHIAQMQCERENELARQTNKILICDTGAFATSIWHRRYLQARSPQVEAIVAAHRQPDLYLLTDVNTPFVQDGTRDGEAVRAWIHTTFIEELTVQRRPYHFISGSPDEKLAIAVSQIDEVLHV
jgi:NadR type nicotinamide-nucleotide adenylyltransferase